MISKRSTLIELSSRDDETGEEISVVYKGGDENSIKITSNKKTIQVPFQSLLEIVSTIEKWTVNTAAPSPVLKAPVIQDHRQDQRQDQRIESDIVSSANDIQSKVDESMKHIDTSEEVGSFTNQADVPVDEAGAQPPAELDLLSNDVDDPIGLSVESIGSFGPVPETPPEFKKQLQEIQKSRANPVVKTSSKKPIVRRDE